MQPLQGSFAIARLEGGDVDQGNNFRVIAGLCDHRATPGVSYQDDRSILFVEHHFGCRHVIFQRSKGILNDSDTIAFFREGGVKRLVARAIGKSAVYKNNIFYGLRLRISVHTSEDR